MPRFACTGLDLPRFPYAASGRPDTGSNLDDMWDTWVANSFILYTHTHTSTSTWTVDGKTLAGKMGAKDLLAPFSLRDHVGNLLQQWGSRLSLCCTMLYCHVPESAVHRRPLPTRGEGIKDYARECSIGPLPVSPLGFHIHIPECSM